jgi:hypothetical protein
MQRTYTIGQRCVAYLLLVSPFLQSCNYPSNSLVPIEAQEQKDDNQVLVNQDALQEEDNGCIVVLGGLTSTQEGLGKEEENEEFQKKKRKTSSYTSYSLGAFNLFPRDLLQETLSYLGPKDISKVRQLNKSFYKLATGYEKSGLVGVNNKPASDCLKLAVNKKNFRF